MTEHPKITIPADEEIRRLIRNIERDVLLGSVPPPLGARDIWMLNDILAMRAELRGE